MRTIFTSATPSTNPLGTELDPISITVALKNAQPGDRIVMRGVYNLPIKLDRPGTPEDPIIVEGHPADGAVIDGNFQFPKLPLDTSALPKAPDGTLSGFSPLVSIISPYIIFRNLTVMRSTGRGISVSNTHHITIDNVTVDWSRNAGIHFHTVEDSSLLNSRNYHGGCFYESLRDPDLINWPVCLNVVYSKRILIRNTISAKHWGESLSLGRDTQDSEVRNCVMTDSMVLNFYMHRCRGCRAVNNLIYVSQGHPFKPAGLVINNEDNFSSDPADDLVISQNIIYNCSHNVGVWGNEASGQVSTNVVFTHNTLVDGQDYGFLLRSKGIRGLNFKYNLIQQTNGKPTVFVDGTPVDCIFQENAYSPSRLLFVASSDDIVSSQAFISNPSPADPSSFCPDRSLASTSIAEVDFTEKPRLEKTIGAVEFIPVVPPVAQMDTIFLPLEFTLTADESAILRRAIREGRVRLAT